MPGKSNGFNMFRLHMKNQLRSRGERKTEEELMILCAKEWDQLDEDAKNEWKCKAREEKFKIRDSQASQMASHFNKSSANTMPYAQSSHSYIRPPDRPIQSSVISVRNVLRAKSPTSSFDRTNEETEMLRNPEKRRTRDRQKFEDSFLWKYGEDKQVLKSQKFYLFSSTVLHFTNDGECIPAEVACVEFTCDKGAAKSYCVPVLIPEESCLTEMQERIQELSQTSHQFTTEDLKVIGKPCNVIAQTIIDMSEEREQSCQNIRFFILSSEMSTSFNCLRYVLKNSDLGSRLKNITVNDISTVDDLAYGLFKVFDVEYPKAPSGDENVDLAYLNELIEGYRFRRAPCQLHSHYDDAVCCGSNLYMVAEIISSSIKRGRFDENYLCKFASAIDRVRQHYYTGLNEFEPSVDETEENEGAIYLEEVESNIVQDDRDFDASLREQVSNGDNTILASMQQHYPGYNPVVNEIQNNSTETAVYSLPLVGSNTNAVATGYYSSMTADSSSTMSATGYISPMPEPFDHATPCLETSLENKTPFPVASMQMHLPPSTSAFSWESFPIEAPDTLPVQHMLPSGRRGFGRGLWLLPESAFLNRLKSMKMSIE